MSRDGIIVGVVSGGNRMDDRGRAQRSVSRDIVLTTLTTIGVMLSMVVVNAMLARRGAEDPFGTLNYAKRVAGVIVPVAMMGTSVGVVKLAAGSGDSAEQAGYRVSASSLVFGLLILGTIALWTMQARLGIALGLPSSELLWATWAYVCAMCLNGLSYAHYRGGFMQGMANWVNIAANGVVPFVVLLLAPPWWDGARILLWMSIPLILAHALELSRQLVLDSMAQRALGDILGVTGRLMRYSLPRFPSALAVAGMFAVGPIVASRSGLTEQVAPVLAAFVVAQAVSVALGAVGTVLLPHASVMDASGERGRLQSMAGRLLGAGVLLSAVILPVALGAARDVVPLWLGPDFQDSLPVVLVVLWSVPAAVIQTLLRSIVDAAADFAWNTVAALAGLGVVAAGSVAMTHYSGVGLALAFSAGVWVQALVTYGVTAVVVGFEVPRMFTLRSAVFAAASALSSYVISTAIAGTVWRIACFALAALLLVCLGASRLGLSVFVRGRGDSQ